MTSFEDRWGLPKADRAWFYEPGFVPSGFVLTEILEHAARRFGDDRAVTYEGKGFSYGEMRRRADAFARRLRDRGIGSGDRVVIALPNWPVFVDAYWGTLLAGAIASPVGATYGQTELQRIVETIEPSAVVCCQTFRGVELADVFQGACSSSQVLFIVKDPSDTPDSWSCIGGSGQSETSAMTAAPDDVAMIIYTSGSTGTPKGCVYTHDAIARGTLSSAVVCDLPQNLNSLVAPPVTHLLGLIPGIFCTFMLGGTSVLMDRWDPERAMSLMLSENIDLLIQVPTMLRDMALGREAGGGAIDQLKRSKVMGVFSGGALVPAEVATVVIEEAKIPIFSQFGLTEVNDVTITRKDDSFEQMVTTVGRPSPGVEIKVVDGDRRIVGFDEAGEVATRSYSQMLGYYGDEERTASMIDRNGWLYTGDHGVLSADGYLRILGRRDDLILRGGEKIYPQEVEDALAQFAGIHAPVVVGIQDSRLGNSVYLVVENEKYALEREEIARRLVGHVDKRKVPDRIVHFPAIPRTNSGKINRKALKIQLEERISQQTSRS